MAYASISQIENDTTSIISPHETKKLLRMKGEVPVGREASWVARVAEKFVGRRKVHVFLTFIVSVRTVHEKNSVLTPTQILLQVHVPLNVHQNHWMLMMFNFDKEEIQILNSLNEYCDNTKEDSLVSVLLLPLLHRMAHEIPKHRDPLFNSSYARWSRFSCAST